MDQTLYRLFYVSKAADGLSEADAEDLALQAAGNNRDHGVVGALCFNGTHFGQVLEGAKDDLFRLMDTIRADPRHKDIVIISEKPIRFRVFKDFHMKHVRGMDFSDLVNAMAVE